MDCIVVEVEVSVNRTFLDCTMLYGLVVRGKKPLFKNTMKTHLKQNVADFPNKWKKVVFTPRRQCSQGTTPCWRDAFNQQRPEIWSGLKVR